MSKTVVQFVLKPLLNIMAGFVSDTNSYIMINDPLNTVQMVTPGLTTAGGEKHYISTEGTSGGHSIDMMIESLKRNPK